MTDWPHYSPDDMNRRESTLETAKLMANAAQTAPNAVGVSQVEAHVVWGQKGCFRGPGGLERQGADRENGKETT